jgi:hypothetical protein
MGQGEMGRRDIGGGVREWGEDKGGGGDGGGRKV